MSLILEKPSPNLLEIKLSKIPSATNILGFIIICSIWYNRIFREHEILGLEIIWTVNSVEEFIKWLKELTIENLLYSLDLLYLFFIFAPLLFLPWIIREMQVLIRGQKFSFNSITNTIEKNGNKIAKFNDISQILIRERGGTESRPDYRLSLVLKNGPEFRIGESFKYEALCNIAEEIADHIGVSISKKVSKQYSVQNL